MKRVGCPVLDVSTKAVEDTAGIIINLLKENDFNYSNHK
jgi:[pyruvate, water dikinase]-phosphate phosphotransferase / [pyruvate, water dikinase] kinase